MPLFRLFVAIAALLAAVLLSWAATRPAAAQIDLSGTWSVQFSGSVNVTCNPAYIKQHGTPLFIVLPCLPSGGIAGTIDKGTGNFTGSSTYLCKGFVEVTFTMSGTAAQDGNTISGTWITVCLGTLSGTFSGQRIGPPVLTIVAPTATLTATPTPPSATPTPTPPALGGVAAYPDLTSSQNIGVVGGAMAALVVSLMGGAVWHARRHYSRR